MRERWTYGIAEQNLFFVEERTDFFTNHKIKIIHIFKILKY